MSNENETANTVVAAVSTAGPTTPQPDPNESLEYAEQQVAGLTAAETRRFCGYVMAMLSNVKVAENSLSRPEAQAVITLQFSNVNLPLTFTNLHHGVAALDLLHRLVKADCREKVSVAEEIEKAQGFRGVLEPLVETGVAQGIIASGEAKSRSALKGRSVAALGGRLIDTALLVKGHSKQLAGGFVPGNTYLDAAIKTGTFLRESRAARQARIKKDRAALAERRDRVYTWVVGEYAVVRKIGAFVYEDQVDLFVPPLTSRKVSRRKAEGGEEQASPAVPIAAPTAAAPANTDEPKPATAITPAAA